MRATTTLAALALSTVLTWAAFAQPPADPKPPASKEKDDKAEPKRYRGFLPPYWNKTGLSDEQRQAIYKIQYEYKSKVRQLEKQILELKKKQRGEMYRVLTKEQQQRLIELLIGAGAKKKDP